MFLHSTYINTHTHLTEVSVKHDIKVQDLGGCLAHKCLMSVHPLPCFSNASHFKNLELKSCLQHFPVQPFFLCQNCFVPRVLFKLKN